MSVTERLKQSHAALKEYFSLGVGNPAQLVVFAEHAMKNGCNDIAVDCVQLYFSLNPPVNQFYVRAHLCEALAVAPSEFSQEELLSHSLSCIINAVIEAKKAECYHFLVYNASVLLWQICRPFQRPGFRRFYSRPLQTVVRALEETNDRDTSWRVDLMIGLVLSQLDGGQNEEAAKTCSSALLLARKKAPEKLPEIIRVHVSYNLGDSKVFDKEIKSSPVHNALIKLYKVKSAMVHQKLSGAELEQKLQKVLTFFINRKESSSSICRKTARLSESSLAPPPEARPPLLLEIGCLAIESGLVGLAESCLNAMPPETVEHNAQLSIRRQVLSCLVMVREGYSKSAVEGRVQTVKRLDDILTSALRTSDMDLIQGVCVAQWNISLPLLQPNLRHHLLKPFSAMATVLEQIDSLLCQMRVGVHFELGKIHADQDQLEASLEHLEKALCLDCTGEYREQISVVRNKVALRAQLYTTPEDPLQRAVKIIEQAGFISGGKSDELRSLLIKAGELLAPEKFSQALTKPSHAPTSSDLASQTSSMELSHDTRAAVEEKGKKMADYNMAKEMVVEHLEIVDKQDDRQRCRVWGDLAKTARKQGVWDVATAAARFCVAYDDGRWACSVSKSESVISERLSSPRLSLKSSVALPRRSSSLGLLKSESQMVVHKSPSVCVVPIVTTMKKEECELIRILANTHFLLTECLVFYLQQEGLSLGEQPALLSLPPALHELWNSYTAWVSQLATDSVAGFLRGAELGAALKEEAIVVSAAAYLWNYHHHWVKQGHLTKVIEAFKPLLASMRLVDMSRDTVLLTRVCSALVGGVAQKWIPKPAAGSNRAPTGGGKKGGTGRAESKMVKKAKGGDEQLQVDPDSGPELKEILEVCEFCVGVWGQVPLSVRGELLAPWVTCKQLLRQPFSNKNYDIEEAGDPYAAQSRAMVAVRVASVQGNGVWDFPNCPTLTEVSAMVSECEWAEVLIETELWVHLAELSLQSSEDSLAYQCASKAVALKLPDPTSKELSTDERVGCELMSLAHSLQGQALLASATGNVVVLRRALEAFQDSARLGHKASSYSLVFEGCRYYWLTCQPLTSDPMERDLLREPLCELLELCVPLLGGRHGDKSEDRDLASRRKMDYELVAHMYSTVFQAYIDKACWEEGLAFVEDALWNTPKPIHTHLISYKLVFKSRIGRSVEGDLIRFQEEPSEFVAALWYKAAINSSNPTQTIKAYQNAIDSLQSGDPWQKIEYLLEFCEWLYSHHFPVSDPINQLEKISEILMSTLESESDGDHSGGSFVVSGVRQLEVLVRVHIMMALLHGKGSSEHDQLSIVAVGLCVEMWKLFLGGAKMPTTVLEWSTYTTPTQVLDQVKNGDNRERGLNKETVTKPMLTLHYLSELVESLLFSALHSLAFPVLKLQLVIAETLIESNGSLLQLYHMQLISLCSDLGLVSPSSPLAPLPDPGDLASSHVEIEQYKTKKAAMEKEESKRSMNSKQSLNKSTKRKNTTLLNGAEKESMKTSSSISGKDSTQRCIEEKVVVREVWVQMARLLIQQGDYQVARDLLNEALFSSQTFNDQPTMFQILVLLARLALTEKNQQLAIKLLTQAQTHPASLGDWLEGMLLLSDVIISSSAYRNQLKAVLEHAMSKVDKLRSSTQNSARRLDHALAIIKGRLALCELGECVEGGSEVRASMRALSDSLTASTKTLLNLGYSRAAASISTQHASFLRAVAQTESEDIFKEWLLEAISLCDRAVCALQSVCGYSIQICQPSEEISLPVQRELVQAQSLLADLLMDAFSHHSSQKRMARNEMKDKSSVEKLIEEFVREEPAFSLMEKEWEDINQMALERALTLLTSAHASAHNDVTLNTKVVLGLGRCLHLLSIHKRPDSALQWSIVHSAVKPSNDHIQEKETVEVDGNFPSTLSGAKYGALSSVMKMKEAEVAESDEYSSLLYISQASHTLVQAVSTSINNSQPTLGMEAALVLVDSCGSFDSTTASLYLALYQSLCVSVEMEKLLRKVLADPSSSKLGALLGQNAHLSSPQSPSLQNNLNELQAFEAWKMMTVTNNHLDLLKQFPSHFRFIVLQHSANRCRLYASYLVPPQPPSPAPKKGHPPPCMESLDPIISCTTVTPKDLDSVLDIMQDFQISNYQRLGKSNLQQADSEGLLKDVLAATESYLSPALKKIAEALQKEKSDQELCVILLADTNLFRLPLEALDIFHAKCIHSVTRDFSLQLLCHRLQKFSISDPVPHTESSRDSKKKGEKYQPQPSTLLANITNFKYVLDPRKEIEGVNPCNEIVGQIQHFSKLTSKWSGYNTGEQVVSVSDWTSLLKEASGLIFFGTENLLAHLPVTNLTPLSLHECSVAVIMDHAHTTQSILHQSKLDFFKSSFELKCERPVETAMFLSLVGVRSVLSNQWTTSLHKNLDKIVNILKDLLSEGSTVGMLNWAPIRNFLIPDQVEPVSNSKTKLEDTQEEIVPIHSTKNTSVDNDLCSIFNCVVYGLPHVNLITPAV